MCTEGREFHVIINGSDMGLAVGNISPSVYGVIDIYGRCTEVELVHDRDISAGLEEPAPPILVSRDRSLCFSHIHGANAVISEDKKKVVRQSPDSEFTEGSVFSNRPLHRNELFEIKIDKLIDQWSGSLQLGMCIHICMISYQVTVFTCIFMYLLLYLEILLKYNMILYLAYNKLSV